MRHSVPSVNVSTRSAQSAASLSICGRPSSRWLRHNPPWPNRDGRPPLIRSLNAASSLVSPSRFCARPRHRHLVTAALVERATVLGIEFRYLDG
jgi:hypothetical protein